MSKEITIIGGGLSGLALGCYLSKHNVKVRIIEQSSYPRHKVCGEFICGVSEQTLDELGIKSAFENACSVEKITWFVGNQKLLDRELPQHGIGISRFVLDDLLQQKFRELGGSIVQERYDLTDLNNHNSEGIVQACGKEKKGKGADALRWLGLKMHVKKLDLTGLEMHTGKRGTRSQKGGYVGLSPIEDGKINVCGLFEVNKEVAGKGAETLIAYLDSLGLSDLATRIRNSEIDAKSFSAVAGFSLGTQKSFMDKSQQSMLIGDAAILIPPFTGNGMSIALESACLAGKSLIPYCDGGQSWQQSIDYYRASMKKKFSRRLFISKWMHPLFFSSAGRWSFSILAKTRLLPFKCIFKLLR